MPTKDFFKHAIKVNNQPIRLTLAKPHAPLLNNLDIIINIWCNIMKHICHFGAGRTALKH